MCVISIILPLAPPYPMYVHVLFFKQDNMTGPPVVVCLGLQMMMSHQVVRVDGAWDGGTMFGMGMTSTHFQQPSSARK